MGYFNKALAAAALSTAAIGAMPAYATTLFGFSFTSANSDYLSGTFTAEGSDSQYTVTGIDGTINGLAITGLSGYAGADQQLFFGASSYFSMSGLSFSASDGTDYNLTNYPDGLDHITNSLIDPEGDGDPSPISLAGSVEAVPEPASWAMMVGGFGLLGAALRRRKVAVSFA